MARKKKFSYKNLVVNEEDLAITKIGEMPNANKSSIFIFVVFGILIAFIFFLPDVVNYFEENNNVISSEPVVENDGRKEEDLGKEVIYYDINSMLNINLEDGININSFVIAGDTISFKITNSKNTKFDFSKKNYFMELYNEDKTLLERVLLSKDTISMNSDITSSYNIQSSTASSVKKIVFLEKKVEDYPNIILSKNDKDEEILTCVKNYETITYKFKTDKLISITDVINYTQDLNDANYLVNLMTWQSRVQTYNTINGVTSSFVSNETGFIVNTVLDLPNVKKSSVDNEFYYPHQTLAKVVNFEMEARGFSCN